MSISKRWFEEQQEEDARQLRDALSDVRYASRVLHGVENVDELTMGDLCRVCRLLASAEEKLAAAVMAEEVAA
jgi:hypothetical protein